MPNKNFVSYFPFILYLFGFQCPSRLLPSRHKRLTPCDGTACGHWKYNYKYKINKRMKRNKTQNKYILFYSCFISSSFLLILPSMPSRIRFRNQPSEGSEGVTRLVQENLFLEHGNINPTFPFAFYFTFPFLFTFLWSSPLRR